MAGLVVPLEQRMTALQRANEVRVYRAEKKRDVRAGREPADFFLSRGPHDPMLQSMRIREALLCMPSLGQRGVDWMLTRAGIGPTRTLGGLSPAQWERLYVLLESRPSIRRRLTDRRSTVQ